MSQRTEWDYVDVFSRRQAIEDGALCDVTECVKDLGFIYPVALTAAVWSTCVTVPDRCHGQSETGRLWDVLWMLRVTLTRSHVPNPATFRVSVQTGRRSRRTVELTALCHGGDEAEPVVTVMLPDED